MQKDLILISVMQEKIMVIYCKTEKSKFWLVDFFNVFERSLLRSLWFIWS